MGVEDRQLVAFVLEEPQLGIDVELEAEGIFAGVSSGAVVDVALRLGRELDEGVVVCVLADGGWRYLSADFWRLPDEALEESMEAHVWW